MSLPTCPTCVYAKGICEKTGVEIRTTTGCTYHTPKSITNADRIRSMSDEELADEILRWFNWLNAVEWNDKRILDWLKQEAKDA